MAATVRLAGARAFPEPQQEASVRIAGVRALSLPSHDLYVLWAGVWQPAHVYTRVSGAWA